MAKVTKAAAKYQGDPRGKERCSGCRHFEPPKSCEKVSREISPSGWCEWYTSKRNWYGKKE